MGSLINYPFFVSIYEEVLDNDCSKVAFKKLSLRE